MNVSSNKNVLRWIIIIFSVGVTSLILWNTYLFFQRLKDSERKNMQEYAIAIKQFSDSSLDEDIGDLAPTVVINVNATEIPIIVETADGRLTAGNLPDAIAGDSLKLKELIQVYAAQNEPIVTLFEGEVLQTTYYGDSDIITKLKYYPLALVLIMFLFGAVIVFFYRSTKASEQNKLWAGMAKESAHQIGTPLSSLVGWAAILRDTDVDPTYVDEMEKDINRLQMITERFSKIGSIPALTALDIIEQTREAVDYIESRSSKLIQFDIQLPEQEEAVVMMNPSLYAWVIENLIKNGIDAMRGKGTITVNMQLGAQHVSICVTDTGKGIAKRQWKQIFAPGFTTKKRGWGLGLSLAKRIISDYHNGKLRVKESKPDHGTTFEILLDRTTSS